MDQRIRWRIGVRVTSVPMVMLTVRIYSYLGHELWFRSCISVAAVVVIMGSLAGVGVSFIRGLSLMRSRVGSP